MRILGLDIGDVKIGYAFAEMDVPIATPGGIIKSPNRDDKIAAIADLIAKEKIELVVAGMPYNMKGEIAHQAEKVQVFLKHLKKVISVPVEIVDERLTSKMAGGGLDDAHSAALILQTYLDIQKSREKDESLD